MKTTECYDCEEYVFQGNAGYCLQYLKPTWDTTVKRCRKNRIEWAGKFCYCHCPYLDDNDGYLCGDEDPSITDIHKCPVFNDILNYALGGVAEWMYEECQKKEHHREAAVNHRSG